MGVGEMRDGRERDAGQTQLNVWIHMGCTVDGSGDGDGNGSGSGDDDASSKFIRRPTTGIMTAHPPVFTPNHPTCSSFSQSLTNDGILSLWQHGVFSSPINPTTPWFKKGTCPTNKRNRERKRDRDREWERWTCVLNAVPTGTGRGTVHSGKVVGRIPPLYRMAIRGPGVDMDGRSRWGEWGERWGPERFEKVGKVEGVKARYHTLSLFLFFFSLFWPFFSFIFTFRKIDDDATYETTTITKSKISEIRFFKGYTPFLCVRSFLP